MEKIGLNVAALLEEANATPMDLIRYGLAYATAYRIARGEGDGIQFDTLTLLCGFFSEKLGRKVLPNDILIYKTDEEIKAKEK